MLAHPSASGSVGYGAADGLNRLPGVSAGAAYAYDANGNQTSDGTRTVTFDAEGPGQVMQVDTASGRSTYVYDPLGRRYSKTTGGLTTVYLHDQAGREVAEYDGSGTLLRRLLYDPLEVAPIAVVPASGTTLYHHPDRLGTPTVVSGDGSTLDVAENEYLANGEGTPTATSFGLAGYRYDPESRLYHVGARDYDPRQGRFVQPDPIGTQGGINLYAYAANDPLNNTDPSGLYLSQVGQQQWNLLKADAREFQRSLGATLDACGAVCDPGAQMSIGDAPGAAVLSGLGAIASLGGTAEAAFAIAPRVAGQLQDARLGALAGQLTNEDLQALINNPTALRVMDTRPGNAGNINVIQNVQGVNLRITTPGDQMRIISVGPIRPNQVTNLLNNGGFVKLP